MTDFLQRLFDSLFDGNALPGDLAGMEAEQRRLLEQAVEHLVEQVNPRFRGLGDYREALLPAVRGVLQYIDGIVESVPEGFVCSRGNYVEDRRVNAFFVSPTHLSEVFSASREVRALFEARPDLNQCWGLLCMRRNSKRRFGMGMMGDTLVRDVSQQVVSFSDHQLLSPGEDRTGARKALKCCVFNNLIDFIKSGEATDTDTDTAATTDTDDRSMIAYRRPPRVVPLDEQLEQVVTVLEQPQRFVSLRQVDLALDRMGVVQEGADIDQVLEPLNLSEIEVVGKGVRVAALVGFLREDLLPEKDMARNAEIFLAM